MIWKDIIGYEGLYQVSNTGLVKSLKGRRERILKFSSPRGYKCVKLYKDGKVNYLVHRLVAKAFIPNPDNKPDVNHLDGVRSNNNAENLEWCTSSENSLHRCRVLKKCVGENAPRATLTNNVVKEIKSLLEEGLSSKRISELLSINLGKVQAIKEKRAWVQI